MISALSRLVALVAVLQRETGGNLAETLSNLAEMEGDLARLKEQIEAIGPVNVLAADEYSGEEERHKFLSVQRADVAASVDSLRQTIKEINQTSSARFCLVGTVTWLLILMPPRCRWRAARRRNRWAARPVASHGAA